MSGDPPGPTGGRPPLPPGTETVLVVEDDQRVRTYVKDVLRSLGYTVLEASRGAGGLATTVEQGGKIDLIITDVVMPGMEGTEFGYYIERRFPGTKILYMSGLTSEQAIRDRFAHEVAFLQKPFTPADLAHKVRELLDPR